MTVSMPTWSATAWAARWLSPVSRIGVSPRRRSAVIASGLVGLMVSATMMAARMAPSQPTNTGVWPSASARALASRSGGVSGMAQSARSRSRPTMTAWPLTTPCTPRPSTLAKPSTAGSGPRRSRAPVAMAWAMGCSEASSRAPARRSASAGSVPSTVTTSTSAMRPVVTVPVLSKTMVSIWRVDSRTSGPLMRIPSWAPRPVPTRSAVGVASPRAQGQAMINTATPAVKAVAAVSPVPSQKPRVPMASPMTIGTNTAEIWSARRCTGALPFWASVTSRAIWASAVSAPIRVARTTSRPPALTVAPVTASPGPTSTGTGSPVSSEASIAELPSSMTPSVATFSPGRTTNRSPTASSVIGMRTSVAVAEDGDVLGAQVEQGAQGGTGAALGAGFEVAAGEDEHDHGAGDLEVQLVAAGSPLQGEREAHLHARRAGFTPEQGVDAPAERGEGADRDQGVHRRRAVAQVHPGGPVERPAGPQDDRPGEGEGEPLPVGELQRVDHRQQQHRDAEHGGADEPVAQGPDLRVVGGGSVIGGGGRRRRSRDGGRVADGFDLGDEVVDG